VGFPHELWGEVPEAFIVAKEGASVSEAELQIFARSRLAHFKVPHRFTFVTELPKTATGKIQKYVLRKGRSAVNPQ
jgi:fatty-acyl-CoA synthase